MKSIAEIHFIGTICSQGVCEENCSTGGSDFCEEKMLKECEDVATGGFTCTNCLEGAQPVDGSPNQCQGYYEIFKVGTEFLNSKYFRIEIW